MKISDLTLIFKNGKVLIAKLNKRNQPVVEKEVSEEYLKTLTLIDDKWFDLNGKRYFICVREADKEQLATMNLIDEHNQAIKDYNYQANYIIQQRKMKQKYRNSMEMREMLNIIKSKSKDLEGML